MIKYSLRLGIFIYTDGIYLRMTSEVFKLKDINEDELIDIINEIVYLYNKEKDEITISNLCETEFNLKRYGEEYFLISLIPMKDEDEILEYTLYDEEISDFIDSLEYLLKLKF